MPMLWHFQQSAAAGRPNAAAERLRSAFAWARVLSFSKSSALQVKLVFHHGRGACAPKIIAGVKGGLVDPGFMAGPYQKGCGLPTDSPVFWTRRNSSAKHLMASALHVPVRLPG
jgi:hypothetical protein